MFGRRKSKQLGTEWKLFRFEVNFVGVGCDGKLDLSQSNSEKVEIYITKNSTVKVQIY